MVFRGINNHRKAEKDPCIGETCAHCGKPIKMSEEWSTRRSHRGKPLYPSEVVAARYYSHEPKCPEEEK